MKPTIKVPFFRKKFKYRPHRGGLQEAMREIFEFNTLDELITHLNTQWYINTLDFTTLEIKPYGYDKRIKWETYVVLVEGMPMGFCNGDPKDNHSMATDELEKIAHEEMFTADESAKLRKEFGLSEESEQKLLDAIKTCFTPSDEMIEREAKRLFEAFENERCKLMDCTEGETADLWKAVARASLSGHS